MNAGQRLRATYEFKPVDHMVRQEFDIWDVTINQWKKEGLPDDYQEKNIFNFDPGADVSPGVNLGCLAPPFIPVFENKKIRNEGETEIIQDEADRWLRILKEQSGYTYMPGFIKHAVTSMKDWEEEVAPRLNPEDPIRYEKLSDKCVAAARTRQKRKLYLFVDSDGWVGPAIPLYLEAGMDVMAPFEVASGCDVVEIGRQWPNLIIGGGIDKRVLAAGKEAIERHLQHIVPAMVKRGGYIPTCDHSVPDDVSLENYLYYHRRICEMDH